ncbi:MAG: sialidase family protein, partial [Acidimicrobiales bacterium]
MNRFRAGLAGAALASLIAAQGALAAEPLRLTQPIQATKNDIDPQRTYSAPHLVVDPSNPLHIIGGFGEMRTKTCGIMRSTDGGQNWKVTRSGALPNPTSHRFCLANNSNIFQANMAFGRDGRLYMAMLGWDEADTRNKASVAMARSDDLGESWAVQTVVRDARPGNDERRENNRPVGGIVVDAKSGSDDIVYVIYQRSLTGTTFTPGNAEPQQPMMAVSTDGGRTFREPVSVVGNLYENQAVRQSAFATATTTTIAGQTPATTTTAPAGTKGAAPDQVANFGGGSPDVTMAGDGTVYVAYR